jgi:PAS domain S-box-containing protein
MNLVRLAYTQFSSQPSDAPARAEFTRFLRYNEAILAHLPLSLVVTDTALRVKLANEHFQKAFGLTAEQCADRLLDELLPVAAGSEAARVSEALRQGEERGFFNVSVWEGERSALHNLRTLPVRDGGQHIGSILLIEDITEYDRMQRQVLLTEKLASVGLLAAGVAHEINNPLEIISNYVTALRRRVQSPEALETVGLLGEEISYISSIVGNLVNLADTGNLAREEIDLNDLVSRLLALLRESAKSRDIRICFRPAAGEVRATVNANEVKQVLLNLVKNSFEAMPGGGTITVSVAEEQVDGIPAALVRVEDDGPGIAAVNPSDVFLPFYTTKKAHAENIGLGLSVSYAILEKYGGRLSVENLPGRGCRFTISLPREGSP